MEKTKGMVVCSGISDGGVQPVQLAGGQIEMVSDFTYLGSNITSDGKVTKDVNIRIAKSARACREQCSRISGCL